MAHHGVHLNRSAPGLSRRSLVQGALAAGGALLLVSCGDKQSADTTQASIRLTDQRGKVLTFDQPVTKVVTVPMPAASILVAVDRDASHLVGMQEESWLAMKSGILGEFFPAALGVPHDVANEEFAPNVESILALEPDVVVQWADEGNGIVAPMENAGMKVLGVTYGTQQDVNTWFRLFATMLGKPQRGEAMVAKFRELTDQVRRALPPARSGRPSILYFNRYTDGLTVAGPQTYNDYYISLIGGTNPASGSDGVKTMGMVDVDLEQVLAWDPDLVLLGNFDSAVPDDVYSDSRWRGARAVQSRRVYKVPLGGYRWDPPSHESPLMFSWLASLAHPGMKNHLASTIGDYYEFLYGRRPSRKQTAAILWSKDNGGSAHYGQFDTL
ncbi:MAG: ABC transporter substrate-binding protein [Nocardioides sp.]|nr:ABC transporter substrate-binding protein [Nocardioides sp.]